MNFAAFTNDKKWIDPQNNPKALYKIIISDKDEIKIIRTDKTFLVNNTLEEGVHSLAGGGRLLSSCQLACKEGLLPAGFFVCLAHFSPVPSYLIIL